MQRKSPHTAQRLPNPSKTGIPMASAKMSGSRTPSRRPVKSWLGLLFTLTGLAVLGWLALRAITGPPSPTPFTKRGMVELRQLADNARPLIAALEDYRKAHHQWP